MKILKIVALAIAVVSAAASTQAAGISGSIAFDGQSFTTDTGDLTNANAFTSFGTTDVSNGMGSYSGTAGETVVFNPLSFDPFVSNNPLWTFTVGPITYSFEALTGSVSFQNSAILAVEGTGIAKITGMDDTVGTFVITGNAQGQSFSFSAGSTVPENGAALAYFGLGLVGLAGFSARRRMA